MPDFYGNTTTMVIETLTTPGAAAFEVKALGCLAQPAATLKTVPYRSGTCIVWYLMPETYEGVLTLTFIASEGSTVTSICVTAINPSLDLTIEGKGNVYVIAYNCRSFKRNSDTKLEFDITTDSMGTTSQSKVVLSPARRPERKAQKS